MISKNYKILTLICKNYIIGINRALKIAYCTVFAITFCFFVGCNNNQMPNLQDRHSKMSDTIKIAESAITLFDTTIEGIRYCLKSPNDTVNNSLFFFANNNMSYELNAEKLGFANGVSKWFFKYPGSVCVYNSDNLTFQNEKLIVKNGYYLFVLSDNGGTFESICVLFRDSVEVKKCFILPDYQSNLINFSDSSMNMLWCSYFDINNDILVIEERTAYYNEGPYLLSVIKIENDTIVHIGEIINDHENYTRFKDGDNVFYRMMKEHADRIISKYR